MAQGSGENGGIPFRAKIWFKTAFGVGAVLGRRVPSDHRWLRIASLIPGKPDDPGRHGANATVIPNNPTRLIRYPIDQALDKERHLVEGFLNELKHFRRRATRDDKTASACLAFFAIAAIMVRSR
jgi:transposase